jgi:outer membrane protein OmpA-like peptidoglycan-associated protein
VSLLGLSISSIGKEKTHNDTLFQIGDKLINRTILFGYNDSCFLSESYSSLDSIVVFLEKNENLCIEVGVHTDSRFSDVYSTCLSCIRSKVIKSYLVSKGINANRITSKGYNAEQLIISDLEIKKLKTEAEKEKAHRLNRRLEFTITCVDFAS